MVVCGIELGLLEYLTYCSYRSNRLRSPDITPERWAKVFGPQAEEMEARFQNERTDRS
jgi:hypothetical protein